MDKLLTTEDGSNTLFSEKYKQPFHDLKTGAIKESLTKHVIPAFDFHKKKKHLRILDICFGIGYNTLSTIYYIIKNNLNISIEIFSPEFDLDLVKSLNDFKYPNEFDEILPIIKTLSKDLKYKNDRLSITICISNARKYIKTLDNIDIVYQDAFSAEVNKELWTVEYFKDIFKLCNEDAILTTYAVSTNIRLSLYEAGFEIYQIIPVKKKQTIAFKTKQDIDAKYIDMDLKKQRNKEAKALYDTINY
ncbi:tRNA (5-methylaminomethyl-2-thiouridine)(34)-methyltransferase MnmD [Arcobacter sp. LA11]|uniref:tRNA (5-methylaminomethyl-2-thiouridine)(34)-methyltransferase MnmD n=1 Tax=Arcobacter sp. LA11 TaxID=1898176 RepID=UPI000933B166|nr:MnmC family methyltransferase [Arcobacter sp. LA11]